MGGTERSGCDAPATSDSRTLRGTGVSFLWPWSVLLGVFYASLLPLRFDWSAYSLSSGFGITRIPWAGTSLSDILTNVVVYVPVGLLFSLRAITCRAGRLWAILLPMAIAGGASLCVETAQTGIAERVASWWDVVLNLTGATVGVILAHAFAGRAATWYARVSHRASRQPFRLAATTLGLALFVYHLMPFDFVPSTGALHASFRRAQLALTPVLFSGAGNAGVLLEKSAVAMWFALFGWLVAMIRVRRGAAPIIALFGAMRQGVVLVGLIEILQLFTHSHVFEFADLLVRSSAAILGALYAVAFARHTPRIRLNPGHGSGAPIGILGFVLAVQVMVLLGTIDATHVSNSASETAQTVLLPFESLWRAPFHLAATDIAGTMVTYALLAVTVALMLGHVDPHPAGAMACLLVSGFALFLAIVKAMLGAPPVDVTDPVLGTLAAFAAVEVLRAVRTPARDTIVV